MAFTVQDGLAIVQGIHAIEDQSKKRDKEQELKDIDAYTELLTKKQKLQDPNAIRQVDQQLNGYTPSVKIRGTVNYQAMLKNDFEAEAAKFKTQSLQAYPKIKAAETLFKTGETQRAMQQIDEILTKHLPNGYTYKTVQNKEGKWEQQIYNSQGQLTKTNIVEPSAQMDMATNLMKSPGNMFELFRKENLDREKQNWESMWNYKSYVDKNGKELYTWGMTDENGKYHQYVAESDNVDRPREINSIEDIDLGRWQKKMTEQEKAELKKTQEEAEKSRKMGEAYEGSVESKKVQQKKFKQEAVKTRVESRVDTFVPKESVDPNDELKRNKLIYLLTPIYEKYIDDDGNITNQKKLDEEVAELLLGPKGKAKGIKQSTKNNPTVGKGVGNFTPF